MHVSRANVVGIVEDVGHDCFFTVTFTKANGEERTMDCECPVRRSRKVRGHWLVKEIVFAGNVLKYVNMHTISEVIIGDPTRYLVQRD